MSRVDLKKLLNDENVCVDSSIGLYGSRYEGDDISHPSIVDVKTHDVSRVLGRRCDDLALRAGSDELLNVLSCRRDALLGQRLAEDTGRGKAESLVDLC